MLQVRDQIHNDSIRRRIQTQIAPYADGLAVSSIVIQVFNQVSLIKNIQISHIIRENHRTSKNQLGDLA